MDMIIKEWKVAEIAKNMHGGYVESVDSIEKETERAYFLNVTWSWGGDSHKAIQIWCPKSATMTEDEWLEQMAAEERRMESGLDYNKKLVEFAKSAGLKGIRERMRTATLLEKIAAAGLTAPARA